MKRALVVVLVASLTSGAFAQEEPRAEESEDLLWVPAVLSLVAFVPFLAVAIRSRAFSSG